MRKYLFLFSVFFVWQVPAKDLNWKHRTDLSSQDLLFRENTRKKDPVFDEYRTVDLGINLGVGSDCGRVNFKSTLQATLKNLLNSEYFGDMGKDILAASPMLVTCYFSPTWCAILKHTQVSANFLSQMRLDQCSMINKYVDNRVDEFYVERNECAMQQLARNGGDAEAAMKACANRDAYSFNLANWAGTKYGSKASSNKLIDSSAKWAGLNNSTSKKALDLVKSMVGDTVVSKGRVSIEWGPRKFALTPRSHLNEIRTESEQRLCTDLLGKVDRSGRGSNVDKVITENDLNSLNGAEDLRFIDRQIVHDLALLPYAKRAVYCKRLASSLSISKFAHEMNQSLDILNVAAQNPNLPEKRKQEIEEKKRSLKDSIDMTLTLHREANSPINEIASQVAEEGRFYQRLGSERAASLDASKSHSKRTDTNFFDCADGLMCVQIGGR